MIAQQPLPRVLASGEDATLRDSIKSLSDSRDTLWIKVGYSAQIAPDELNRLRETNRELTELLQLVPGPNTPVFDPLATRLELARCQVCVEFIRRAELETNNTRHPGNSAVVSAAKMFLENEAVASAAASADESAALTPAETAQLSYGG